MGKDALDSNRLPDTAEGWWVLLAGDAPVEPALAQAFERWKRLPGNASAYAEVARMWADMDAGLGDPQLRDWLEDARAPARPRWSGLRRWVAVTAVAALLLATVPVMQWMVPGSVDGPAPVVWQPVETQRGQVRGITLADGSVMHLDTATRAEVNLEGAGQRLIRLLEGRVRIDVGADPRPLTVHAGPLRIDHIGTIFDLSWHDGVGEVLLREGALQVRADGRSQALAPGDRLLVDGSDWRLEHLAEQVLAGSASWTAGRVEFDDRPLIEVAQVLTAYGPRDIRVDPLDPAAALRVSGVFQTGRQQAFLDALSHVYPIVLREREDGDVVLQARD